MLSTWLSPRNGGVYEAVLAQAAMLRDLGAHPVMLGTGDAVPPGPGGVETHLLRAAGPSVGGYAPGLARALDDTRLDLLHLHGIWQYPSLAASRWAERTGRPCLISPHGMLDPWITGRGPTDSDRHVSSDPTSARLPRINSRPGSACHTPGGNGTR